MKIAWFKKVITPELGTLIAGYMAFSVQKSVHRVLRHLGFLLQASGGLSGFRRL